MCITIIILAFPFMFRFNFNTPKQLSTDLSRLADAKNNKLLCGKKASCTIRIRMVRNLPLGPVFSCLDTQKLGKAKCALPKASKTNLLVKNVQRFSCFAHLTHPWTVPKPHDHLDARYLVLGCVCVLPCICMFACLCACVFACAFAGLCGVLLHMSAEHRKVCHESCQSHTLTVCPEIVD